MKKKLSILKYAFILVASFCSIQSVNAVYSDSQVGSYETELAKFPTEYQVKIKQLHSIYPNAIFVKQDKFLDWNKYTEVEVSWNSMIETEKYKNRSEIYYTAPSNYKTSTCGEWSGSKCTWYVASEEAIKYYMDPYNFLDEKHVFMFESQYYKDYHIKEGVEKILDNSFMSNKNCPGSNKKYSEVLLEAAAKYNVSPYMLAARLIQEQGRSGSSALISGTYSEYENLYDYFNIKAGGKTDEEKIKNGLTKAREEGWTTPYLSIMGGAKFIYKEYVGINDTYNVKGQMTNYLQKWDPYGPKLGLHQYMQNIQAPYSEAVSTYNSYSSFANYKNFKYVFYIQIYQGAPHTTNTTPIPGNLGDLNGDGKIDKNDLLLEQSNVFGYTGFNDKQVQCGDVNKDGKVDKNDLLLIQSYVFGYIKSF